MKKNLYSMVVLAMSMAVFSSCNKDEEEVLKNVSFEGTYWTALVDNPQYLGEKLYGTDPDHGTPVSYTWIDTGSKLTSSLTVNRGGYEGYAEGGIAISNYIDADIEHHATLDYQLAVPTSNGSSTFAVVHCPAHATLRFSDGVARLIKTMQVSPTTYQLGVITYGNSTAKALTEKGDYLTVTITGQKGDYTTGTITFDLARDGEFLKEWKTIDLTALGEVNSITFKMEGSDQSSYGGINAPAYFAFDNVVVRVKD